MLVIAVTAVINFTNFMDGLDVGGRLYGVGDPCSCDPARGSWPIWALVGAIVFLFGTGALQGIGRGSSTFGAAFVTGPTSFQLDRGVVLPPCSYFPAGRRVHLNRCLLVGQRVSSSPFICFNACTRPMAARSSVFTYISATAVLKAFLLEIGRGFWTSCC